MSMSMDSELTIFTIVIMSFAHQLKYAVILSNTIAIIALQLSCLILDNDNEGGIGWVNKRKCLFKR